jgi:hypothetical protein
VYEGPHRTKSSVAFGLQESTGKCRNSQEFTGIKDVAQESRVRDSRRLRAKIPAIPALQARARAGMRFLSEILGGNSPGIPHLSAAILAYSRTFFDRESAEFPQHIVMKTG